MKSAIALFLIVAGISYAAPLIDEPVAELRLKSGKVLTRAVVRSYNLKSVLIRHDDGSTLIEYGELPIEHIPPLMEIYVKRSLRRGLRITSSSSDGATTWGAQVTIENETSKPQKVYPDRLLGLASNDQVFAGTELCGQGAEAIKEYEIPAGEFVVLWVGFSDQREKAVRIESVQWPSYH